MAAIPFDISELVKGLEAQGLDLAEVAVKDIVTAVFDWAEKSAAASDNLYLKFIAPVLEQVKPVVLAEVDKINGKIGA